MLIENGYGAHKNVVEIERNSLNNNGELKLFSFVGDIL